MRQWFCHTRGVRQILLIIALVGGLFVGQTSALAAPASETACTFNDSRLTNITGLVATSSGYQAVAGDGNQLQVFTLDSGCKITETYQNSSINPFDPQDLAQTSDGTTWVADIGDEQHQRATVAIHKIAADRSVARIYRLQYPTKGVHSQALIMQNDGTPILIGATRYEKAAVYTTDGPISRSQTNSLHKVGDLSLPPDVNSSVITGAALAADGKKVAVRTGTKAYQWSLPNGQVAQTLTNSNASGIFALTGESEGTAISYTPDGQHLVTVSGQNSSARIHSWSATATTTTPTASSSIAANSATATTEAAGNDLFKLLPSLSGIYWILAGITLFGIVLATLGITTIVRSRHRNRQENAEIDAVSEDIIPESQLSRY